MTETCGMVSREKNPNGGPGQKYGSSGILGSGIEAKIVSVEKLIPLPPNQLGEIWLRGPNIMQGDFFFLLHDLIYFL